MPVGVTVNQRRCEDCNGLTLHKIEYHYVPEKKVIKECHKCGKITTSFHGSGKVGGESGLD